MKWKCDILLLVFTIFFVNQGSAKSMKKSDPFIQNADHELFKKKNVMSNNLDIYNPNRITRSIDKNRKSNKISYIELKKSTASQHNDTKISNEPHKFDLDLRQVYEELSNHLFLLQSRVETVESVADNILTKLTAIDCSDIKDKPSGNYIFNMNHGGKRPVSVRCNQELDDGGWTVIQQRLSRDASEANASTNFDRGWYDYKVGFGDPNADYWIGLENIYIWTNTRHYELRIDLTDFSNETSFAYYRRFYIDSERENYRLHVSDFSGTAGDSLTGAGIPDNFTADGMMFSTTDNDNDASDEINCSQYWKIGGWWFNRCSWANLNGPYLFPGEGDGTGINWHRWRNNQYLKATVMMIRPTRI